MPRGNDICDTTEYVLGLLSGSVLAVTILFKVPQIYIIISTGSTSGISLSSLVGEWIAYTIMLTYQIALSYPLYTYFEHIVNVIQINAVLIVVLIYRGQFDTTALPVFAFYLVCFYAVAKRLVPDSGLSLLILSTVPVLVVSKLAQLLVIVAHQSAGNVSALTWAIVTYKTGVRMLTTWFVTGDMLYFLNLASSQVFNVAVLAAILFYTDGIFGFTPFGPFYVV